MPTSLNRIDLYLPPLALPPTTRPAPHQAVHVLGGHWTLEDCQIDSSKRSRASSAVIVGKAATLDLRRCGLRDCLHAVVLERSTSTVQAAR